jgi:hypothetical protein
MCIRSWIQFFISMNIDTITDHNDFELKKGNNPLTLEPKIIQF